MGKRKRPDSDKHTESCSKVPRVSNSPPLDEAGEVPEVPVCELEVSVCVTVYNI